MDDVAVFLRMQVPDAVALLEAEGYGRSVEQLRLSQEEETARYAAIRRERLERAGRPVSDDALVVREVIASQRIAGIDARPWLAR